MTPASFDSDMNGAEWRSVESISRFLKKYDKKLSKVFQEVWFDDFIGQEDLYEIRDELLELLEENE
jgi:hypothetical protein